MTNYENLIRKKPIIESLQQKGWTYIPGKNLPRTTAEPLLIPELKKAVSRINPDAHLTDIEIENLIEELRLKTTTSKGAKEILQYLRDGIPATPKKTGTVTYIHLISDDTYKNTYTIADEITHSGTEKTIRCDILLYINGIPTADIECKDPTSLSVTWADAYKQLQTYQQTVPELFKYVQIGIAADTVIRYFPTTPWNTSAPLKTAEWNIAENPLENIADLLSPVTLTKIIKNYTFIRTVKGIETKVLPRYIQYRAAEKIITRVKDNLTGKTDKNKGLIWHWQGSGKTLTMTYAANILYKLPALEKPTIFFITDRTDLETQLIQEYKGLAGLPAIRRITTIRQLITALSADNFKGRREIMTVLVQKFKPGEFEQIETELKNTANENITTRKNIILLIDEAHRTQEGILSGQMRNKILTNAFAFAFTGTPNAGTDKNTFTEFSYPPEEEYLDKYDMGDSNSDGFTLPLTYQPRLFDGEITAYKDAIETFLNQYLDDIDDIDREKTETAIKKQIKAYKLFLEHPEHIKKAAADIAKHFKTIVEPAGFKAMVICTSRKACVLYKKELDKNLGNGIAEVVMTYQAAEKDECIRSFQKIQKSQHQNHDETAFTNEYRDNFKETPLPKILIVTDKLLAGFDAPQLQTIYLDKLIKGNKLLQAVTRCNRPAKNKEYGQILDYAGILQNIEKALQNYSRGALGGAIINKKELAEIYAKEIIQVKNIFGEIKCGAPEAIEEAVTFLIRNPDLLTEFLKRYSRLKRLRTIIESSAEVINSEPAFVWFTHICDAYKKLEADTGTPGIEMEKVYKAVHENVTPGAVHENLPEYKINSARLKNPKPAPKAANIAFALEKFIRVDAHRKPAYESLLDKIERTISEWREKNIDNIRLCELGHALLLEGEKIESESKNSGLTEISFGVLTLIKDLWAVNDLVTNEVAALDTDLKSKKLIFPGWQQQPTIVKEVEREIKSLLRRVGKKNNKSVEEIDELFDRITKGMM